MFTVSAPSSVTTAAPGGGVTLRAKPKPLTTEVNDVRGSFLIGFPAATMWTPLSSAARAPCGPELGTDCRNPAGHKRLCCWCCVGDRLNRSPPTASEELWALNPAAAAYTITTQTLRPTLPNERAFLLQRMRKESSPPIWFDIKSKKYNISKGNQTIASQLRLLQRSKS